MDEQERIGGHDDLVGRHGDVGGRRGRDAIDIGGDVGGMMPNGVVDGDAIEHVAAKRVDAQIKLGDVAERLQFGVEVLRRDRILAPDERPILS